MELACQPPSSSGTGIAPVSRLVIIRDRFKARGFSEQVVQLLMGGNRDSTISLLPERLEPLAQLVR